MEKKGGISSMGKLFIPRKISGKGSRWEEWNKDQPIIDGIRINQYDLDGGKQGMWYDYFDDEEHTNIYEKGHYKNNMKIGLWYDFHYSGKINEKSTYSNTGRKIGIWTTYDYNGYITKTMEYKNNSLTQVIRFYQKSNQIRSITNYNRGMVNGLKTIFHKNGKPEERVLYTNNKIDKWSSKYSKTGKLIRIIDRTSLHEKTEYILSNNAKKNKLSWWRNRILKQQKISQDELTNIINQAKSEALFQI
jgi:antitoxin component YwqK of YwqJK toxin-antitoxin module